MTRKQTQLTKEQKQEQKHLRWLMSKVQTLESRIESDKDFAAFMGEFTAGQVIKIDIDKATEIFGSYFPDFWVTYTATDVRGAEMAASSLKKTRGGKYKEVITKSELLAQGLEGAVKYLVETGEGRHGNFGLIYDCALKLKDSRLIERIAKLIGDYDNLDYNELVRLADKTKNTYLLQKAGEAMIKQADKVKQSMLKKEQMLYQSNALHDAQQQTYNEELTMSQRKTERMSIDFASHAYRNAWKSRDTSVITKRPGHSYMMPSLKTFMKPKYDDRGLMKKVLGKLTGYRGKQLADFEDQVYRTLNGIFDWSHYKNQLEYSMKSFSKKR